MFYISLMVATRKKKPVENSQKLRKRKQIIPLEKITNHKERQERQNGTK